MARVYKSIRINEGGNILVWGKNFKAEPYRGNRRITFCVELKNDDPDMFYGDEPLRTDDLIKDGWNVKVMRPNDDDPTVRYYIQVNAQYRKHDGSMVTNPPRVVLTDSKGKVELDESSIAELDDDNIVDARMIIRPYEYDEGKISAKLKTLFVKVDGKIHRDDDSIEDFD